MFIYRNPKRPHCPDLTEHGNPVAEIFEPLIVIQVNTEFYKGRGMNTFDVTLKCKNGEIKAHRNFLASASPVFDRMLYGDFKEREQNVIELPEHSYATMRLLMDFIYTGQCRINELDDILLLLQALDYFQIDVPSLRHVCGRKLLCHMNVFNCCSLAAKFSQVLDDDKHNKIIVFIAMNFAKISEEEFFNLPLESLILLLKNVELFAEEIYIFKRVVNWHWHSGSSLTPEKTTELFGQIRYTLMIPEVLKTEVMANSLANEDGVGRAMKSHEMDGEMKMMHRRRCVNLLRYRWELPTVSGNKLFNRDSGNKIILSSCHEPKMDEYEAHISCTVLEPSCIVSFHVSLGEGTKQLSFIIKHKLNPSEENVVINVTQEVPLKKELDFIIYFRLKHCFVKVYADGIVKHVASVKYQSNVHQNTICLQSLAHPFGSRTKFFPHLSMTAQYQSV